MSITFTPSFPILTTAPAAPAVDAQLLLPCQQDAGKLWFAERPDEVELAKALCQECPLQAQCLEGARERAEPWGVWGGELFLAGEVVPFKRPRGRPRKSVVAA